MSNSSQRKRLSIKQLECRLQDIDEFERPKIELEQYATPPHIAATILNTIDFNYNDINDKFVADLGCGTGRLAIGSILCGANQVVGYDIDNAALECALVNVNQIFGGDHDNSDSDGDEDEEAKFRNVLNAYKGCGTINFVLADLASVDRSDKSSPRVTDKKFDTVIMNPPFGTKKHQGLDMIFLEQAIRMSAGSVYSLHKTSTRDYIMKRSQHWGVKAEPVAQIRYNLENTYKFHKRRSVDIDVDLWKIKCFP